MWALYCSVSNKSDQDMNVGGTHATNNTFAQVFGEFILTVSSGPVKVLLTEMFPKGTNALVSDMNAIILAFYGVHYFDINKKGTMTVLVIFIMPAVLNPIAHAFVWEVLSSLCIIWLMMQVAEHTRGFKQSITLLLLLAFYGTLTVVFGVVASSYGMNLPNGLFFCLNMLGKCSVHAALVGKIGAKYGSKLMPFCSWTIHLWCINALYSTLTHSLGRVPRMSRTWKPVDPPQRQSASLNANVAAIVQNESIMPPILMACALVILTLWMNSSKKRKTDSPKRKTETVEIPSELLPARHRKARGTDKYGDMWVMIIGLVLWYTHPWLTTEEQRSKLPLDTCWFPWGLAFILAFVNLLLTQ